jgi:hypothetical protein
LSEAALDGGVEMIQGISGSMLRVPITPGAGCNEIIRVSGRRFAQTAQRTWRFAGANHLSRRIPRLSSVCPMILFMIEIQPDMFNIAT